MNAVRAMLRVTTAELAYLVGLFGAEGLIGVENPFAGWPVEEIETALYSARRALADRGLLSILPDGAASVGGEVPVISTALAESTSVVVVTRTDQAGHSEALSWHVHPEVIIEVRPDGEGRWMVSPVENLEDLVWRALGLSEPGAQDLCGGSLPRATLAKGRDAATNGGPERCAEILQGALAAEVARALAGTLVNPSANGALAVMERSPEGWKVEGVAFLEGAAGLWLMRTHGDAVQVEMCSGEMARAEVVRLVGRLAEG